MKRQVKAILLMIIASVVLLAIVLTAGALVHRCERPLTDRDFRSTPLLWKVTDAEGHELYLFGTIHVGDDRNDEALSNLSPYLDKCDALAVEFDMVAYQQNAGTMMQMMSQYVLTDGTTIEDHMPADLYSRAYALVEEAGLMPGMMKNYNLAMWAQLVQSAAIMTHGELDSGKAMDLMLINRAYEKQMPVLEVESAAFQMGLLNSFDEETYLWQIRSTIDNLDLYGASIEAVYSLWLSGNQDTFWGAVAADADADGSGAYNTALIDERNVNMAEKAKEYLASGKTVFFAVGAAHMANETGIVQLLTDAGYTVERIVY